MPNKSPLPTGISTTNSNQQRSSRAGGRAPRSMINRDADKNDLRTRVGNYFQIYWRVRLRISGEEPAEIRGTALIQQSGRHMILQDFVPSFTTQRHNYRPGISIGFRQTASVGPAGAQNRRNRTNRRYRPASAPQTRTNNETSRAGGRAPRWAAQGRNRMRVSPIAVALKISEDPGDLF